VWGRVYIKRQGSIHLIEVDFLFMSILAGSEIRFFFGFARVKIILSQNLLRFPERGLLEFPAGAVFGLPYLRPEISIDCKSRA